MSLVSDLKAYKPLCEQEHMDKEQMLSFIERNNDYLLRSNPLAHFTASSWIVNEDFTKVLLIYHNIYNSWSWTGGHADDDEDLLHVCLKEATEETGIKNFKVLSNGFFSIESLHVSGHIKKGKYVSSHIHLNVTYLLMAKEEDQLMIKPDENSGVKWVDVNDVSKIVSEKWMNDYIYQKLIKRVINYKNKAF